MEQQIFKIKCYGRDLVPGDVTKLGLVINLSKQVGRVTGRTQTDEGLKVVSFMPDRQYDIHRVLTVASSAEIAKAIETKTS